MQYTKNSRLINANPDQVFRAFTTPDALEKWQAPENMTARVHDLKAEVGGGYTMSLYYPEPDAGENGKTSSGEDRFRADFKLLEAGKRIIELIRFETENPDFSGEMIMDINLEKRGEATFVTIEFSHIPAGIDPKDNEEGTESSLQKLAAYLEQQ